MKSLETEIRQLTRGNTRASTWGWTESPRSAAEDGRLTAPRLRYRRCFLVVAPQCKLAADFILQRVALSLATWKRSAGREWSPRQVVQGPLGLVWRSCLKEGRWIWKHRRGEHGLNYKAWGCSPLDNP